GVVVVLDHQAAGARPGGQFAAAPPAEDDPGGELVGGGEHHRAGAGGVQLADPDPVLVDRDRRGFGAAVGQVPADPQRPGLLHRDGADPRLLQDRDQHGQRLGDAGDDEHLVGAGADAAAAGEPAGDRAAQRRRAGGAAVAPVGGGAPVQHRPHRAPPRGAAGVRPYLAGAARSAAKTSAPGSAENSSPEAGAPGARTGGTTGAAGAGAATTTVPFRPRPLIWPPSLSRR